MSRQRIPVVLVQLYGVPAPKRFNLRILEGGDQKDHLQSGRSLGHHIYDTYFLLQQLTQEGYVLTDVHQKMRVKPATDSTEKTTPVIYLTFLQGGTPVVVEGLSSWLQKLFSQEKATDVWVNQPCDRPAMLSLNMTQAIYRGDQEPVKRLNLRQLIWVEEDTKVV